MEAIATKRPVPTAILDESPEYREAMKHAHSLKTLTPIVPRRMLVPHAHDWAVAMKQMLARGR
ncbi:hypothetical protein KVP10_08440 [Candidimonas humi]|uniref:Uncharacterized protein n=1 Tax=Candidimonas humi TaxID=683355 RepID=A0ABV8NXX0_9BURK|nr:hypothetical protein [Candidimonas humi]MBV6304914.1 hypothetical protein [Candidimonas humi]